MTGTTTGQTSLPTATDSDDNESYLTTSLVTALQTLANLFESATGHDHTGAGKGKPIGSAGIASNIHLVGPVVDSGGLTVTAGNVGIGGAPTTNSVVRITGSVTSGSTTEVGVNSSLTSSSGATTEVSGFYSNPATAASVFTVTTVAGFHALNPSKGATSVITSAYGLLVDGIGAGNTNNYGVFISAPSGGAGVNYGLYNAGTSRFDGGLGFGIVPLASTAITVSGTLLPARTAGNVYVVWDTATGAFKQSAIGPAS